MLKIENLTKQYDEKKAVDDLSLHICPGEIYGLSVITAQVKLLRLKHVREFCSLMQER